MPELCIFCDKDNPEVNTTIMENGLAYARLDNYPVSRGHVEIVPRRHVESFFDLSDDEVLAIYALLKSVRKNLLEKYRPDAFNIGVNDGVAAGRTAHHLHVHIIPRYTGDTESPRGGIRNIIPGKGDY